MYLIGTFSDNKEKHTEKYKGDDIMEETKREAKSKNKALKGLLITVVILTLISAVLMTVRFILDDNGFYRSKAPDVGILRAYPEGADDELISQCIISEEKNNYTNGKFCTESHVLLGAQEYGDRLIVYVMSLYEEWDNAYSSDAGRSGPAAVTLIADGNGWKLENYWTPQDGSDYERSIKEKFPEALWKQAMDTQEHIEELQAENKAKAEKSFAVESSSLS